MNLGQNLIFLISQPRAGSTMLQRIIGSHPDIHTTSEPWLMLHPLYSLRKTGIETEYSNELALKGLLDFLDNIDNGPAQYHDKMREMYGSLYARLLESTGKKYYLDKTPRYYFIIKELYELFPKAKFLILFRNPLAVLSSIIENRIKGNWDLLSQNRYDLLSAPDFLLNGIEVLGRNAIRLQYENILANPDKQIKKTCDYIGVSFESGMIEYGNTNLPKWQFGDQDNVYEKTKPDDFYSDKWIRSLKDLQTWRIIKDYLEYLGESRTERMGYSFTELSSILQKYKPDGNISKANIRLLKFLEDKHDVLFKKKQLEQQLQQNKQTINSKNRQIEQNIKMIRNKDQIIKDKGQIIKKIDNQIRITDKQLQEIRSSYSFRLGRIILFPLSIFKKAFLRRK